MSASSTDPFQDVSAPAGHRRSRVIVGVDGSPGARTALAWAMEEAARRKTGLDVVTVLSPYPVWVEYSIDPGWPESAQRHAESRARDLLDQVRAERGADRPHSNVDVDIDVAAVPGVPAEALTTRARPGDLLVLGSRGRGAFASAVLGSVALRTVTHAPCPVVVVPNTAPRRSGAAGRVVVGIDGSEASRAALAAAADQARRLGGRLEAVVALEPVGPWVELTGVAPPEITETRESARTAGRRQVAEVLGDRDDGQVDVLALDGPAATVLTEHAADADLLVVGSRGHTPLAGLVLGSVALRCVVHAPCPVMVVHPDAAPADAPSKTPTAGQA